MLTNLQKKKLNTFLIMRLKISEQCVTNNKTQVYPKLYFTLDT